MSDAERIAVLEAEMKGARSDITEIKGDVKLLLLRDASRSGGDTRLKNLVPFVALAVSIGSAWAVFAGG